MFCGSSPYMQLAPTAAPWGELGLTPTWRQFKRDFLHTAGSASIPQTTSIIRTPLGTRSIACELTVFWKCLQVLEISAQRMAIGFLPLSGLPLRSPLMPLTTFMFGIQGLL